MPGPQDLMTAAMAYAREGRAVFPCNPRTKAPLTPRGFHDASTDLEVVRDWWVQYPDALIGGPVPEGQVCLDLDPRHGGDAGDLFHEAPETAVVASGGPDGSRHYYFERPEGPLSQRGLPPGWDLRDAGRHYLILPPSPHPDTGRPYRWIRLGPLASLPAHVLRILRPPIAPNPAPGDPWASSGNELGVPVPRGQHDDAGARFAARLAAEGVSWTHARPLLVQRCLDFVDVDPARPFTERDLEKWWRGAHAKFAPPVLEVAPTPLEVEEEDPGPTPVDWRALWADQTRDEWLVAPLLAVGAQTVLYSPPKVGKSILALEIAAAVAKGATRALGVVTDRPRSVVYVDHENRLRADVRARLQDMGHTPADLVLLHFYSFPAMPPLDSAQGGDALVAMAKAHGADLVVVDTISRAVAGEENSNDTWNRVYRLTGKLLKREGIALLRIDHTGKDRTAGQRGGSAKSGDVDMVWELIPTWNGRTFALSCKASRLELEEDWLTVNRERGPLCHRVDPGTRGAFLKAARDHVVEALDDAGAPLSIGVSAAADLLDAADVPFVRGLLTTALLTERRER